MTRIGSDGSNEGVVTPRWQYRLVEVSVEILNRLGQEGWEVVAVEMQRYDPEKAEGLQRVRAFLRKRGAGDGWVFDQICARDRDFGG